MVFTLNLGGLARALRSICDSLGKRGYNCKHDVVESYLLIVIVMEQYNVFSPTSQHHLPTSIVKRPASICD